MSNSDQCYQCRLNRDNCNHYNPSKPDLCQHFQKPLDNSKMFARWYSFNGRIGRMEFALTVVTAFVLGVILLLTVGQVIAGMNLMLSDTTYNLLAIACFIPSMYLMLAAGFKRIHDAGMKKWFAFTPLFVLLYGNLIIFLLGVFGCVYLLKDKGEEGINEYGSNPTQPYNEQLMFDNEIA